MVSYLVVLKYIVIKPSRYLKRWKVFEAITTLFRTIPYLITNFTIHLLIMVIFYELSNNYSEITHSFFCQLFHTIK